MALEPVSAAVAARTAQSSVPVAQRHGAAAAMVVAALIIAALYVGREVFVPAAVAVVLSFVLAPAVRALRRLKLPRAVAVLTVVTLGLALTLGLAALYA